MLKDRIISILAKSPADQYSLYRQLGDVPMSGVTKAIADLQRQNAIHTVKYRKSARTGLDIPVYSLSPARAPKKLDVHGLLAGVTSERIAEYGFVARNLMSPRKRARILDIGSAGSELVQAISGFGSRWQVVGIDLAESGCDARVDARHAAFQDEAFDQVISVSTIEHVGLPHGDENGDAKAMQEILRVLKRRGSAIVTVPYGKEGRRPEHRVYDRSGLLQLSRGFVTSKKEFYCLHDSGKWLKCSQAAADKVDTAVPRHLHSAACACLLLKKKQK